jgi:two-component system, OmpR family, KDP operon response regulator KdpE
MTAPARILVVDDEPHIRRLLDATLTRAGYGVVEAGPARRRAARYRAARSRPAGP